MADEFSKLELEGNNSGWKNSLEAASCARESKRSELLPGSGCHAALVLKENPAELATLFPCCPALAGNSLSIPKGRGMSKCRQPV